MFTPPDRADRLRAVGSVAGLPPPLRRALDEQGFDPIPRPGPHDWLASHPEPGQTFAAFLAGHPPSPGPACPYLQPFGPFDTGQGPPLDLLSRFAAAFFRWRSRCCRQRRSPASPCASTGIPGSASC